MGAAHKVYLEAGRKRIFACAIDRPGWCRSARGDDRSALQALVDCAPRYKAALKTVGKGFVPPRSVSDLELAERLKGDATTDFGAPGVVPDADRARLDEEEVARLLRLHQACWRAFDRAVVAAHDAALRMGPRGGGRDLGRIVEHVLEADRAYLARIGGLYPRPKDADPAAVMAGVHSAIVDVVKSRARGEAPPRMPRSGVLWPLRYGIRRSAWHALDHTWEIEDRAAPEAIGPS